MISDDDQFLRGQEETNPFDGIPRAIADQRPSIETGISHDDTSILGENIRGHQTEKLEFFQLNLIVQELGQCGDRLHRVLAIANAVAHRIKRLIGEGKRQL